MLSDEKIADIFKTTGQPHTTYVQRDSGNLEKKLNGYLDESGVLCLITGPSKTGKSTLYKKVLSDRGQIPLIVQCTKDRKIDEIWRLALESVDFERVTSNTRSATIEGGAEAQAEFGWKWLAKITGTVGLSITANHTEGETRERILSRPSPDLLIPILKHTNYIFVLEDFHYLEESEKVTLFQQWKKLIDSEVTVLVLGTTHRAVDIANSNRDLLGRIAQIDVTQWSEADLMRICTLGFEHLRCTLKPALAKFIATEAVGLPIIVQQVCLEIFNAKDIYTVRAARKQKPSISQSDCYRSCHDVARTRYTQFGSYYSTLIRGPREKLRKYKTYELVLACFTIDPIQFALTRHEIDIRLAKVAGQEDLKPPAASINSTLGALKEFQEKRGFELLEWRSKEDLLYIVEPSFLFYVRWRKDKNEQKGKQLDLFEELLGEWSTNLTQRTRRSFQAIYSDAQIKLTLSSDRKKGEDSPT